MRVIILLVFCAAFAAAQVPCTVILGQTSSQPRSIAVADCERDVVTAPDGLMVTYRDTAKKLTTELMPLWWYGDVKIVYQEPAGGWNAKLYVKGNPFAQTFHVKDRRDIKYTATGVEISLAETWGMDVPSPFFPWAVIDRVEVQAVP
jgi:hypothetical protein